MFTFHVNAVVSTRRLITYFSAPEIEDSSEGRPKRSSVADGDVQADDNDNVSKKCRFLIFQKIRPLCFNVYIA